MTSPLNRSLHRLAHHAAETAAKLGERVPHRRPETFGITLHRNLRYAPSAGNAHLLDVYVPKGPGPHPVMFYVHGGGFAMLSKNTHRFFGLQFARRGFLVININYRLGLRNVFPVPLQDAAAALIWTRENAATYGGDLDRLVIAGESAGGNLALALTLACIDPPPFLPPLNLHPIAALPLYGMIDVSALERLKKPHMPHYIWAQLRHAAEAYLGKDFETRAAGEPWASPLRILESKTSAEGIPPMFTCIGTADPLLRDSRRLGAALTRLGIKNEVVIAPGELHAYNAFTWRPAAKEAWKRTFAFLNATVPGLKA